jgi:hypothetical protein
MILERLYQEREREKVANSQDRFNYGPALPDKVDQKTDEFEGPAQVATGSAAAEAAVDAATGMYTAVYDYARSKLPSKMMSADEFKDSSYNYQGATVAPKSEAQASVDFQRHTSKTMHNAIMSGAPEGLTTTLSTFGSSYMGFMLNPVNLLAFTGAAMLVGKGTSAVLNGLEESKVGYNAYKKAAIAANAVGGAAIGVGGLAPDVGSRYLADKALDQNPDGIAALATLAWGAGIGGAIGGVFGRRNIMKEDAFTNMRATAVEQLSNGKTVEVGPIVQDGYRRARAADMQKDNDPTLAADQKPVTREQKTEIRDKKIEELEKQNEGLKSDHELAKEFEKKQKGKVKDTPAEIEAWERARNDVFKDIRDKDISSIKKRWKAGEQLTDREAHEMSKEIHRMRESGEMEDANHHSELRPSQPDDIKYEKLRNKETPEAREKYEELKAQMEKERVEKDIKDIKARWEKGKHLSDREKYELARNKTSVLAKQLEANSDAIAEIKADQEMDKNPGTPVDKNELDNIANRVSSPEGDLTHDQSALDDFNREMEDLPDTAEKSSELHQDRVNRLERDNLLNEEQKAILEEAEKADKKGKSNEKYLEKLRDCLLGGE